jgi:hypothetical protein
VRHCNCGLLRHVTLYKWALVIQKLHQHYFFVQTPECITSRGCLKLGWSGAILCLPLLFRFEVVDSAFIFIHSMIHNATIFSFMLFQKPSGSVEEVQEVV